MKHFSPTALCAALALFLANAIPLQAAEAPKPRNASKLIVINDDGFSPFYSGRYKTAEDLRQQMLGFRDTQVAVMEWCVAAGSRVNYPSKVSELIGEGVKEFPRRGDQLATETLHRLVSEGVDTLQVVTAACHEAGLSCYASLRMNGDYPASWMGEALPRMLNSSFWWAHPEFRQRGKKGEDQTKFSFAFPEVREFKLGILREVVERDLDGINLDFQRHPNFFAFEEPMAKAFKDKYGIDALTVDAADPRWEPLRGEIVTAFVRDVRKLLDEAGKRKGRHLGLSARVDWKKYRTWGCDIETWLQAGLLDYLVVGQYGLGGYEFDFAPFAKMAQGTGCAVLFGEEATLSGHDLTPQEDKLIAEGKMKAPPRSTLSLEQYQARAARWYAAGADGVHLFNEGSKAVLKVLGSVKPAAEFFRATISPVDKAKHGQWNVALTELAPGRVLAIWEAGNTEAKTPNVIMAAVSGDGGRSWNERGEFVRREGMRCTPCGFYRAKGLLHCVHAEVPMAGGKQPCRVLDRSSSDHGATWSEAREFWRTETGVAMQPVVLRDGRIALPVYHRGKDAKGTTVSEILVSKDDGASWQGGGVISVDLPGGAMEPALVETSPGEWLCTIRTRGTGRLHATRSHDSGQSWVTPEPLPLESPESIARLLRLADGSILVVWNGVASKTQGPRDRLTVARSLDDGLTWPQRRDVVQGGPVFSNHGVTQTSDGRVLIGYQHFHRDPERAPERSGVDSVELVGLELSWLDRPANSKP